MSTGSLRSVKAPLHLENLLERDQKLSALLRGFLWRVRHGPRGVIAALRCSHRSDYPQIFVSAGDAEGPLCCQQKCQSLRKGSCPTHAPHPSQGFANQQRKEEDHKRDKQEAGPPKGVKYQPAPQVACLVAIEMGEIRNRSIY